MDHLWSPWRYTYLTQSGPKPDCIFCEKAAQSNDAENLIVHRAATCFALLNLYPYNNGHLMVAPYAHIATLEGAAPELAADLMRLTRMTEHHLRSIYAAPGFNIGMNIGSCAGAGIAGHIHMHVVPRWPGDTNFMTTLGETRVLGEDLHVTWSKLRDAFARES